MYRLLVVTDSDQVRGVFDQITEWDELGYRPPRFRQTADEVAACMQKHHIDAVALSVGQPAYDETLEYLRKNEPNIPIFQTCETAEAQRAALGEVRQLLNRMHADFSDDLYDEESMLKRERDRWMHQLLSGKVTDARVVREQMLLFRSREAEDAACIVAELSVPHGDSYLAGRWHYGSERLEMALRNFFGERHADAILSVAVVTPKRIRVLACPPFGAREPISREGFLAYVEEIIQSVQHYMGLDMTLKGVSVVPTIAELAALPLEQPDA